MSSCSTNEGCGCHSKEPQPIHDPEVEGAVAIVKNTIDVLNAVWVERERQDAKWGNPDVMSSNLPYVGMRSPEEAAKSLGIPTAADAKRATEIESLYGGSSNASILIEEVAEAIEQAAAGDDAKLETELIQVAAVAVKWVEIIRKRNKR